MGPYRSPCDPRGTRSFEARRRRASSGFAPALGALVVLLFLPSLAPLRRAQDETRELLDLPDRARAVLYKRSLDTVQETCFRESTPLRSERCSRETEHLSRFPECDEFCRRLISSHAPRPTR